MPAVSFEKTISLGNLISAGTILVTATVFVVSIRAGNQVEMTELRGEMRVYSTKLEQLGRDFGDYKTSTQQANSELRTTLNAVSTAVADMRVLIAGQKDGRR